MTDSIITRATRALAKSQCGVDDLDGLDEEMQAKLREDVRAVLEAIREPSEGMVEAGMDYDERELNLRLGRAPTVEECQIGEWSAMIDAALSE